MNKREIALVVIQIVLSLLLAVFGLCFIVLIFIGGAEILHKFGPSWLVWGSLISFIVYAIPAAWGFLKLFLGDEDAWIFILWPVIWHAGIVVFILFQCILNLEYARTCSTQNVYLIS